MLKKARAEAGAGMKRPEGGKGIPQAVLDSSHQIWLAGLGAFAKAQQGGKQVFDMLVKQGEQLEAKTRTAASQTAEAAREVAKAKAKEMQAMAGGTWDKLEQVFEDRVARALGRLGVYTSADVERLTERVNELSEAVNALLKARGIERRPASPVGKMAKGARRKASREPPGSAFRAQPIGRPKPSLRRLRPPEKPRRPREGSPAPRSSKAGSRRGR
jgi:poly(hydroxyalkanoate) granule-associated protein